MSSTHEHWEVVVLYKDAADWTPGDLEPQPRDVAIALAQRLFERLVVAGTGSVIAVGVREGVDGDVYEMNASGELSEKPFSRREG